MTAPIVCIDRPDNSFGMIKVLEGICFDVTPGEKLALVDPSGSGKSTIPRIVMTLETIPSDHIEVCGERLCLIQKGAGDIAANEAYLHQLRSHISMVFPHFNLFSRVTVPENFTPTPILTKGEQHARAAGAGQSFAT